MLMRKRKLLFIAAGMVLVAAIGTIIYITNRSTTTPTTYAKAKATRIAAKCMGEGTSLGLSSASARESIEQSAISYLIDVPAGTNVGVKIASLTSNRITGSDRYPAKYGSYNFVMEKQDGNWIITNFKHCG
jgi:hypothetical protein